MINISLPILPIPWKAPYVGSRGAFSPRYNEAKIIKAMLIDAYKGELILGPVRLDIDFFFPVPKSAGKKKRLAMLEGLVQPEAGGDVTNLVKFIEDQMQGIVIENDKQVKIQYAAKWYACLPRIDIVVAEL